MGRSAPSRTCSVPAGGRVRPRGVQSSGMRATCGARRTPAPLGSRSLRLTSQQRDGAAKRQAAGAKLAGARDRSPLVLDGSDGRRTTSASSAKPNGTEPIHSPRARLAARAARVRARIMPLLVLRCAVDHGAHERVGRRVTVALAAGAHDCGHRRSLRHARRPPRARRSARSDRVWQRRARPPGAGAEPPAPARRAGRWATGETLHTP